MWSSYTAGKQVILLEGKFKTMGEKVYSCLEKVQEFGLYANLLGNYPSLGIRQKLTVIWLTSRLQDNLLGKLDGFCCGLVVGNLTSLGKKVSSLLGIYDPKFLLRWIGSLKT